MAFADVSIGKYASSGRAKPPSDYSCGSQNAMPVQTLSVASSASVRPAPGHTGAQRDRRHPLTVYDDCSTVQQWLALEKPGQIGAVIC